MPNLTNLPALVASGRLPGFAGVRKYGRNTDVDASFEDIWTPGGTYAFQASAQSVEILSSSASDTAAGTGAQAVTVEGLDGSGLEQSETVATNGVTPVALSNTYAALHRAYGAGVGSAGTNVGTITVRIPGPGATLAEIPADKGQTQMAIYTVPSDKQVTALSWWGFASNNVRSLISTELMVRVDQSSCWRTADFLTLETRATSLWRQQYEIAENTLGGGAEIRIRAMSVANNSTVEAGFDLLLEEPKT